MLSIATDYAEDKGCPEPHLRRIAETGFSHVHWCHHWNTDFLYADCEVEQIAKWLKDFGLKLNDLHASAGSEKAWTSPREYERLAGVELVKNRISMTATLSSDAIVLHLPAQPEDADEAGTFWARVWKSLDELQPCARECGVRMAIENGDFDTIEKALGNYDADYLGLCYDSGHGNMRPDGLDRLEGLKDRLICIHLHDNDGTEDQHKLPFSGTSDWARLMQIIAASSYEKCIGLETLIHNTGIEDETVFLQKAFDAGRTLTRMVREAAG